MKNARGFTSRLKMTPLLRNALTDDLTARWNAVDAAFDKAADAHADALTARQAATDAPNADAAAARDAARAGKRPPASTAHAATIAAGEAERYAAALDDLANEVEAEFMGLLYQQRPALAASARDALTDAVLHARTVIVEAQDAVRQVGDLAGLWAWAKSDTAGMPVGKRLARDFGGVTQECVTFIGVAGRRGLLRRTRDAVEQRQAERDAEWAEAQGVRATADGVVLTHSERGY